MRDVRCPMCNDIAKRNRHVCKIAKKAMSGNHSAASSVSGRSPFDESFPSSEASSSSGEMRVMFSEELVYDKLEESIGLTLRSTEKMNNIKKGYRLKTLCPLAAVCKTEVDAGTKGRVIQILGRDVIQFRTDCGKVCFGEARDLSILGPLSVGQKITTTVSLVLTSDDMSFKVPPGSSAIIRSFEDDDKTRICVRLSQGPTCTINATDVIPTESSSMRPIKAFFSKVL
eukprot:TRINITY_DN1278_c8_g1_i1.p1 TRINITY_DN1278_c8_g1~~TRINITY_DN1278_c8_g1_i1.p1  ORF type:complete len:243 (+),score=28.07 TRINITY_DN1278_c8_g1_i1:48-731(+)